ncbi:hypothetical protein K493DRAFT_309297 [Basidiobolus meristosporus CBS 931.73]|uniref:Transcription factor domain-containing protein n=1 Tax=Basidiobolus meristosporus CBS 931.73 TaxID=1314790 RepID=A0A1Y1WC87_9FUNG|nr:hypothetical protein K493DRAFT_309297 [Basidiobolus meristosporus CBS 931.73]|eukprot:ORX71052.1 hypothetical protein K493DRAFT_309297 [Basidiobolus meristosporus CBS 931.73]
MFAIGSRFFIKNHELGVVDKNTPKEWLSIVKNANFTETSLMLAQQQIFMEPNTYNAIALTFLSTMLYYDGENSQASTCLVMAAKIVQELNMALEDAKQDTLSINPTCIIEKEERRRLFWCLLLMERWAQKVSIYSTRVMDEKRTYVLPPGSESKWQRMSYLMPETQSCIYSATPSVISFEDRQMWSFMIEIELLHSDISSLANSLTNYKKLMMPFGDTHIIHQPLNTLARLEQLKKALQSWDMRLPAKHRYTHAPTVVQESVIIQLDTIKIPRWMRILYLVSKLHLYEIRMAYNFKDFDGEAFRECLATVAEFVEIIRLLPIEDLTHDPIIFFNAPFAFRVLLTIVNCLVDESESAFSDADKLIMSRQVKQQADYIYELVQEIDPIWRHVIQDISYLTQMKDMITQVFSLLEAPILETQVTIPTSPLSETPLPENTLFEKFVNVPGSVTELETFAFPYHG